MAPDAEKTELLELCQKFIDEEKITSAEAIYQCDNVIEHAYDFIEDMCKIVGYAR